MRIGCLRRLALASVTLVLSACGGSSGAAGPSNSLFSGTYDFMAIGGSLQAVGQWGTALADGAGNVAVTVLDNTGGVVSTVPFPFDLDYSISSTRAMVLTPSGASTPVLAEGRISSDGRMAVAGVANPGDGPTLIVFRRHETGFSNASLNGAYGTFGYGFQSSGPDNIGYFGTVTFDGSGAATASLSFNDNGVIAGPFVASPTYTVSSEGVLDLTLGSGGDTLRGGVLAGGQVAVASGATNAGGLPGMVVLVRQATSASLATLTGDYASVTYGGDASGAALTGSVGTAVSDGAGSMTLQGLLNDGGVITPAAPFALPYAVAADGTMSTAVGFSTFTGAVSPDGAHAVFAGGTSAGADIRLLFLMR